MLKEADYPNRQAVILAARLAKHNRFLSLTKCVHGHVPIRSAYDVRCIHCESNIAYARGYVASAEIKIKDAERGVRTAKRKVTQREQEYELRKEELSSYLRSVAGDEGYL